MNKLGVLITMCLCVSTVVKADLKISDSSQVAVRICNETDKAGITNIYSLNFYLIDSNTGKKIQTHSQVPIGTSTSHVCHDLTYTGGKSYIEISSISGGVGKLYIADSFSCHSHSNCVTPGSFNGEHATCDVSTNSNGKLLKCLSGNGGGF